VEYRLQAVARWQERGVWADLHAHVASDPDLPQLLIECFFNKIKHCISFIEPLLELRAALLCGPILAPEALSGPVDGSDLAVDDCHDVVPAALWIMILVGHGIAARFGVGGLVAALRNSPA
jgi:hypothetical protein